MQISVIIPVANAVDTLERTIQSVTAQPYEAIEILLIDAGSTDGSGALADRLAARDDRIHVTHEVHTTVLAAYRAGVAQAKGDDIVFLNGGDILSPDILKEFISYRAQNMQPDVFVFNMDYAGVHAHQRQEGINGSFRDAEQWFHALFAATGTGFSLKNKIFKRELITKVFDHHSDTDDEISVTYDALKVATAVVMTDTVGVAIAVDDSPLHRHFGAQSMTDVTARLTLLERVKQDFPSLVSESAEYLLDGILETGYQLTLSKGKLGKNVKNYDKQLRTYHDAHKRLLTADHIPAEKKWAYVLYCQVPALYAKVYPALRDSE